MLPAYERLRFAPRDAADLTGLDLVFCALPHGESQAFLPGLLDHVGHAIDLGADFRLPPDIYSRWYGEPHGAPAAADAFAYGLVELYRDDIATHAHVASPGCYPTAVSLACAPLVALELVEPRIIADAVSGVSGAGRGLKTSSLFSEANENVSAPTSAPAHSGQCSARIASTVKNAASRNAPAANEMSVCACAPRAARARV